MGLKFTTLALIIILVGRVGGHYGTACMEGRVDTMELIQTRVGLESGYQLPLATPEAYGASQTRSLVTEVTMNATEGDDKFVRLADYEPVARKKMNRIDYEYIASGAGDEITIRRNSDAWSRVVMWPSVLVDVSNIQLGLTLFGEQSSMPIIVPPMGFQKLVHPDGEVGLARAAHAAGLFYCMAQQASTKLETIAKEAPGPKLQQLYIMKERDLTVSLIRRAEAAGVKALVITVDAPVLGDRANDLRNNFTPQSRGVELANFAPDTQTPVGTDGNESTSAAAIVSSRIGSRDEAFTWQDIPWLRSITHLPIVLKGILRAQDARLAVEHGVDAIWVSNHGGRQLDGSASTCEALPLIAKAVGDKALLIVDGGLTTGADVVKALALGAKAVAIGRPLLWALASGGGEAVKEALDLIRGELRTAMALSGAPAVGSIPHSLVEPLREAPR